MGQLAVRNVADLTAADVAASDDITGHNHLGGNWELEVNVGRIESSVIASLQLQSTWHVALLNSSPIPQASFDIPSDQMINEPFQFSVIFDNVGGGSSDIGFAPYLDLSVPPEMAIDEPSLFEQPRFDGRRGYVRCCW